MQTKFEMAQNYATFYSNDVKSNVVCDVLKMRKWELLSKK